MIGCLFVFMVNQILIEYQQLKKQPSVWYYYSDVFNLNDNVYLLMNLLTLILNGYYGHDYLV